MDARGAVSIPGRGEEEQFPGEKFGALLLRGVLRTLQRLPKAAAAALFLALTAFIGWVDRETNPELTLFVFYAIPIALSVAVLGTRAGFVAAGAAAVAWWFANQGTTLYTTAAGYLWAMISRLFYFGTLAVAVAAARKKQEADAAQIRALEERRRLERELVRVSEHEQQRIGQDLHDGLCQRLAAIGCAARMLADDLQVKEVPESRDASMIEGAIQEAVLEARSLARGIFPVHVDREGLPAALSELCRTTARLTGAEIQVRANCEEVAVKPQVAMHLYRIAQEAVANAVRHSGASEVVISLRTAKGHLEMKIEDNGNGLTEEASRSRNHGMGFSTMRYRAEAVAGSLEIGLGPQGGTLVAFRVPLNQALSDEDEERRD